MSIFSHFSGISLTADQRNALTSLETFLADDAAQVFILRGYAGTGKTFLMLGVAAWLQEQQCSVLFSAPTGRAAKVLQNRTGVVSQTMHRAIYALDALAKDDGGAASFKLANRESEPDARWVFVVDEASMVGDVNVADATDEAGGVTFGSGKLLRDYVQYANFKAFPRTKMVFVGDGAQLPPVGMKHSPALNAGYLSREYALHVTEAVLQEVVRQKSDTALLISATNIREALATGRRLEEKLPVQSGEGLNRLPASLLVEKYLEFSNGRPNGQNIIIAHSNEQVTAYNKLVRQQFFPFLAGQVAKGDILVVGQNAYHTTPNLSNGEIVRVEAVGALEVRVLKAQRGKIAASPCSFLTFSAAEVEGTFHFRDVMLAVKQADGSVANLEVKILENWLECAESSFPWAAAHLLRKDAMNRFYEANKRLYFSDKVEFERQRALSVFVDPYANALRCRFGYAITCHKAQGGEWKYVFADLRAKMSRDSEEYYRWAYTAITRAKKRAWLAFSDVPKEGQILRPVLVPKHGMGARPVSSPKRGTFERPLKRVFL
jgi:AAA domain/UvrD-like helicase C-terminal domain